MNKPISERFSFLSGIRSKYYPIFRDSNHILNQQRLKRKIEAGTVRRAIPKTKKKTNGNGKKKNK